MHRNITLKLFRKNKQTRAVRWPSWILLTNPGRFGPGSFRPESFRPGSFRPNLGVGRFGLGRWVDSALGRFGPGSFRPKIDR